MFGSCQKIHFLANYHLEALYFGQPRRRIVERNPPQDSSIDKIFIRSECSESA